MAKKVYKKGLFNALLPWLLVGSITNSAVNIYISNKQSEIIDDFYYENNNLRQKLKEETEDKEEAIANLEEL